MNELESGSIAVTDSTTGEKISSPLTPTTLVARVMTYRQMQEISYGFTSQYPERIQAWKLRSAERIVSSTNEPGVENKVLVEGDATELWHNGSGAKFMPMAVMPGMEKIIYPYCTGSTFRGGKHRLHGKKLPGNYLGIITSENPHNDSMNMPWNPAGRVHLRHRDILDRSKVHVLDTLGVPVGADCTDVPEGVVPVERVGGGPVSYTHLTLPTICSV